MSRRTPYLLGRVAGLNSQPLFHHRNGLRYDSSKANLAYSKGYNVGMRERIAGRLAKYDLFEMHGIATPLQRKAR